MLAHALVVLSLAATPVKVATTGWLYVGIDERLGAVFLDRFVTQLGKGGGVSVLTQRDVEQVMGMERQRQLAGCSDSGCLAELVGALGVDVLLTGSLAKTGSGYTVTLRARRALDGAELTSESARVGDDEELQDWLDAQAPVLARRLTSTADGPAPAGSVSTRSGSSFTRLVPGIVGVALAGAGVACFIASKGAASELRNRTFPVDEDMLRSVAARGQALEATGLVMMIGGGVAVAASIVWWLLGPSDTQLSLAAGRDSVGLTLSGVWQ